MGPRRTKPNSAPPRQTNKSSLERVGFQDAPDCLPDPCKQVLRVAPTGTDECALMSLKQLGGYFLRAAFIMGFPRCRLRRYGGSVRSCCQIHARLAGAGDRAERMQRRWQGCNATIGTRRSLDNGSQCANAIRHSRRCRRPSVLPSAAWQSLSPKLA